jgi:hypothetical protein
MKLTKEQQNIIIKECKTLTVPEAYAKLGFNHVTIKAFHRLLDYRNIEPVRVYTKRRTIEEKEQEIKNFITTCPNVSQIKVMKVCRVGWYELNDILVKLDLRIKDISAKRTSEQIKEQIKNYFDDNGNASKNKAQIAKELRLNRAYLNRYLDEMGLTTSLDLPVPKKYNKVKAKKVENKPEVLKGFCNSCSKETKLYLVVKVETIKTRFSSYEAENDRYLCIDCKGV